MIHQVILTIPNEAISQMEWYHKLVAIDNLWGTGGAAFMVVVLTNIFVRSKDYRLLISFFFSLAIAGVMVYLAKLDGVIFNCFIVLANAIIITSVAYAANDLARIGNMRSSTTSKKKGTGKMGAQPGEEEVEEKGFFKPWL